MNFRKLRKFAKNAKALSPVIATIILIAVTVAVSVVVAAWMGGLTLGFMGTAEQASITNVVLTNTYTTGANPTLTGGTAVCTVQNTGSATVTISSGTVDGATWTVSGMTTATTPVVSLSIAKGTTSTITLTFSSTTVVPFSNSAQYTIKLTTAKGNTEVYQQAYTGP